MVTAQTPSLNTVGPGGQTPSVSVYLAGNDAIGANVPMDVSAIASATSPTELRVPTTCTLIDFVAEVDAALAGVLEWYANGMPTGVRIALAAHQATNNGRPALRTVFRSGVIYRLKVVDTVVTT